MARWRAPRRQLRYELRGGLRALNAGRRGVHGAWPNRGAWPQATRQGPRSRWRGNVRIRQPSRLLAADAAVPGTQAADDDVRLRTRSGASQARRRRHPRLGLRCLLPRLALGQTFRADRSRGARAHPKGCRVATDDRGRAPPRLVLPLWARREHAPLDRRGGRLSLRPRLLWPRAAFLEDGQRSAAPDCALLP